MIGGCASRHLIQPTNYFGVADFKYESPPRQFSKPRTIGLTH